MRWKFLTTMVFASFFWDELSSSLAVLYPQDHSAPWLFKFSATVVAGIAVAAYVWRRSRSRLENNAHEFDDADEDPKLNCRCGLPAKLRISRTSKNPFRLFYNCPRNVHHQQCEFFLWSDEISSNLETYLEEKSCLREECIRLQQKMDYIQSRRRQERNAWDREKRRLRSLLSEVRIELDDLKKKIMEVNESEEMPPIIEELNGLDEDEQDCTVIMEAL